MIIDSLDNASAYESLGPGFAKAFAYLQSDRPMTDPLGKHELDGEDLYVSIDEYNSKPIEQGRFEAHRKYADVQYIVSGHERIGYTTLDALEEEQAYDEQRDVAFYKGEGTMLDMQAGRFTVFLPQDAHMPCIAANGKPEPVRKVVVKVRIGE